MSERILLCNISQVVQVVDEAERDFLIVKSRDQLKVLSAQETGEQLAILMDRESGLLLDVGAESELKRRHANWTEWDCQAGCILPGFVDGHTHPCWAGDRVNEFAMKMAGAKYMEIHEAGGGINFTVRHTTEASEDSLFQSLVERLQGMLKRGTTTVECKTGYGLHYETELKMLRVLTRARKELAASLDISITYLAAHSVPTGSTADQATRDIVDKQMPALKRLLDSGEIVCDNVDVFCEKGVFSLEQTRSILEAGMSLGLAVNFHADELNDLGGAKLAGELRARAASHLEKASPEGIKAMAETKTAAVLLPTTAVLLKLDSPPAREFIEAGVPVALGSDFNPNAFCLSMPLVMFFACTKLDLNLEQAMCAATLNSAYSLGLSKKLGAVTPGRQADLVLVNCPRWEHVVYQMGNTQELIQTVWKKARVAYKKPL